MNFEGKLKKDGRFWLVEVPALGVMTQGRNRKDALRMVADAIESMVNYPKFKVTVTVAKGDTFLVGARMAGPLVALFLREQRHVHGLSYAQLAERLGSRPRSTFAKYEAAANSVVSVKKPEAEPGRAVMPTVQMFEDLVSAVAPVCRGH